jgi:hypothetical protein
MGLVTNQGRIHLSVPPVEICYSVIKAGLLQFNDDLDEEFNSCEKRLVGYASDAVVLRFIIQCYDMTSTNIYLLSILQT